MRILLFLEKMRSMILYQIERV